MFKPWPHKALSTPAAAVAEIDEAALAVWTRLLEAMYGARALVGLAAPQIGLSQRLAVVDCSASRREPVRLANPELIWASTETARHAEGSPNLPGLSAEIERPARVRVRFLNETGAQVECDFDGLWAASVQHQIDHLEGRMFFERLSRLKRQRLLARHAKQARKRTAG
ncbi:MAG: peptide deformylase [Pseudomonadota bacterium]